MLWAFSSFFRLKKLEPSFVFVQTKIRWSTFALFQNRLDSDFHLADAFVVAFIVRVRKSRTDWLGVIRALVFLQISDALCVRPFIVLVLDRSIKRVSFSFFEEINNLKFNKLFEIILDWNRRNERFGQRNHIWKLVLTKKQVKLMIMVVNEHTFDNAKFAYRAGFAHRSSHKYCRICSNPSQTQKLDSLKKWFDLPISPSSISKSEAFSIFQDAPCQSHPACYHLNSLE